MNADRFQSRNDDRPQSRSRKRQSRMQRQVFILMILLVAILVMLVYFRQWLDGFATAPPSDVPAEFDASPE